jgi:hypothetical protein
MVAGCEEDGTHSLLTIGSGTQSIRGPKRWHDRCSSGAKLEDAVIHALAIAVDAIPYDNVPRSRWPLASVPLPRHERLDFLRGMLARLDDATPAGQTYMMTKILPLLRREALDPTARFKSQQLDLIMRSLDELEHETSRISPNAVAFDRTAQILVDVFALA